MRLDSARVGVVLAAGAVLLLTVLGAAVGGSWQLEERDFGMLAPATPAEVPPPPPRLEAVEAAPAAGGSSLDWGWVGVVGVVLRVVLIVVGLWWLWTWLQRRVARRPAVQDVETAPASAEEPALPVLQRGVADAQQHLAAIAGPSDAVIAAWLALEEAATASGVRRAPSQTPTEFTVAVLDATSADPDATTELLALYHRARFSSQPIEAGDVDRASRCLASLTASWALVGAGGPLP